MNTDLKVGSDLNIEAVIGAWGGNTTPTITLNVGVSTKALQKVFDVPNGASVVILYTKTVMGVTYSDELFYSASDYKRDNDFQTRNKIDFTENRSSEFAKGPVCVSARASSGAPAITYKFKVLYSSCKDSEITWYVNEEEFANKTTKSRPNVTSCSTADSIDKTASTTQILTANSDGTVDGFDMLEHNDYIINTEAIGGDETKVLTLTCSDFQHDKIYRITLNNDVYGIELTAGESHELITGLVPAYTIINVVPVDMTSSELGWQLLISWQEQDSANSTYSKEEIDNKFTNVYETLTDRRVAHNTLITGSENYTLTKEFINTYSMVGVRPSKSGVYTTIEAGANYNNILFNVYFDDNVHAILFTYNNFTINLHTGGLYYAHWDNDTLYMHQLSMQQPIKDALTIDLTATPRTNYLNSGTFLKYRHVKFINSDSATSSQLYIQPSLYLEGFNYCITIENAGGVDIKLSPMTFLRCEDNTYIQHVTSGYFTIGANKTCSYLITESGLIEL